MNLYRSTFAIVMSWFLITVMPGVLESQESERPNETARTLSAARDQKLLDLIRGTQQLVEQTQAELKRSREQTESLQRLLEHTHQEVIQLREEMKLLRSRILFAQANVTSDAPPEKRRQNTGESPTVSEAHLAARLTGIEDQVELNTAQIKEHDQTKVESSSRFKVNLFGTVLNNTYFNTSDSSGNAVPTVAQPTSGSGRGNNLGATLRQTEFGFSMTGPKVGAARLSAEADFDFFGGATDSYGGNALGVLRMRTATARLDGPRTSLVAGLMDPLISPLNPTSLAAVYYPSLGESGNLWQWRPQVTVERHLPINESSDFVLQGGLMLPFGETVGGTSLPGRPGYEARAAFAKSIDADRRLEIGFGGYFYPQLLGFPRTVNSYAATSDWLIPLTGRLVLSGEAFYGRSISLEEQSGADISSVFAFSGPLNDPLTVVRGIHSVGGWAQLSAKVAPKLEFNLALGEHDPRNRDIFAGVFNHTTRLNNQTFSLNSIYRFRSNFLFAVEYRQLWTTYPDARSTNGHLNVAIGYVF